MKYTYLEKTSIGVPICNSEWVNMIKPVMGSRISSTKILAFELWITGHQNWAALAMDHHQQALMECAGCKVRAGCGGCKRFRCDCIRGTM